MQNNILDDMEHRIRKVIAANRDKQGFPRLEDYGIEEEDFDDYLFYKQAVIDDVDSLRLFHYLHHSFPGDVVLQDHHHQPFHRYRGRCRPMPHLLHHHGTDQLHQDEKATQRKH